MKDVLDLFGILLLVWALAVLGGDISPRGPDCNVIACHEESRLSTENTPKTHVSEVVGVMGIFRQSSCP